MTIPYKFSPFLLLRSPVYSIEKFRVNNLREILSKKFFRTALYFATPTLYAQVSSKNFDASRLTSGLVQSLINYYNRMSCRPTPFGMFSAFSDAAWGDGDSLLVFSGRERLHIRVDYGLSQSISEEARSSALSEMIYSNPTIYEFGKELRYIKASTNYVTSEKAQGISAVDRSRSLVKLFSACKNGIALQQLQDLLLEAYPLEDPVDLIDQLQSEELLYSSFRPNVTGENYLRRVAKLSGNPGILGLAEKLDSFQNSTTPHVNELEELVRPFVNASGKIRTPFYVNFEREVTGNVSKEYQGKLLRGLYCLGRLRQDNEKGAIGRFKKRFLERFEEREVPLMEALDPEAGIGYEYLEETAAGGELLKGLTFEQPAFSRKIAWGPVQDMLMNKMSFPTGNNGVVITDDDLETLPLPGKPLSPGISVMFRVCGERVLIESAGGATATALIGRFTSFNEKVLEHARALAEAEQQANPGVIFAEIAYSGEEHAANINTREHIRHYEIPLLVHSTLPRKNVIGLNDLYVSVQRNEVILRSARLKQRIIPRSSTAYNHIRSELPVFRFLSDLQYQGIESNFTIKPEDLLPGRAFYPRIEYQDCILSPAAWVFKRNTIKNIRTVSAFLDLAAKHGISRFFALSDSDRQLTFDLHDVEGLEFLLNQIKDSETITLREFFKDDKEGALLRDRQGNVYVHQLIACLLNPLMTYLPISKRNRNIKHTNRYVFPGNNWIYFKIYCSSQNADHILFSKIYPLIKKYRGNINKWFFVRYNEPEYQLRIRICGQPEFLKEMPGLLNTALKPLLVNGIISRLQIDTYIREIERYGPETIDQAENVFKSSSELVALYFRNARDEIQTMQFAVVSTDEMLGAFKLDLPGRVALLERICTNLIRENGNEKSLRNDLNRKYRELQPLVIQFMRDGIRFFKLSERRKLKVLTNDLVTFNGNIVKFRSSTLEQSVSDMLHMHMNRIFSVEQRKNELVIYYMCLRFYISIKARNSIRTGVKTSQASH